MVHRRILGTVTLLGVGVGLLLLPTGCSVHSWVSAIANDEQEAVALNYIALLQSGDFDAIAADVAPEHRSARLPLKLLEMKNRFPAAETPTQRELLGYKFNFKTGQPDQYRFVYRFTYPDQVVLITLAYSEFDDGSRQIHTFNVNAGEPGSFSLLGVNFAQFGPLQWAQLVICLGTVLFIVWSLVACIRTQDMGNRKGAWFILILLGVVGAVINPQGPNITLYFLKWISLAGLQSDGVDSSSLAISLPFGAIWFWLRRLNLRTRFEEGSPPELPPS